MKKMAKKTSAVKKKTAPKKTAGRPANSRIIHKIERVPIDSVTPDPENANQHPERQIEMLMESIGRFGQLPTIIVGADGTIIKGNGTHEAAKRAGLGHVDIIRVPLEGAEARAFAVADNRLAELSEWDLERLEKQVMEMTEAIPGFNLGAIGFDQSTLDDLLGLNPIDGVGQPIDNPGEPVAATDRFGVVIYFETAAEESAALRRLTDEGYPVELID